MKLRQCRKCGIKCFLPFTVTEQKPNGNYETFKVCTHCLQSYVRDEDTYNKLIANEENIVHIKTSDELFTFLTENKKSSQPSCKCGMTEEEFKSHGRLGCPDCYNFFGEKLMKILKQFHGSTKHVGKIPKTKSDIMSEDLKILKLKYAKALELEDFEKCKEIKKQIDGINPCDS